MLYVPGPRSCFYFEKKNILWLLMKNLVLTLLGVCLMCEPASHASHASHSASHASQASQDASHDFNARKCF